MDRQRERRKGGKKGNHRKYNLRAVKSKTESACQLPNRANKKGTPPRLASMKS